MGLFDKIFPKKQIMQEQTRFTMLNGDSSIFTTNRMQEAYNQELIRSAIDARARHISKLKIEMGGTAKRKMQNRLKHAPNEWQTWAQFLYRTSTILDTQNTCFIVPMYDEYGEINGVFPILPSETEVVDFRGNAFLRFRFMSGKTASVEMKKCGILTKFQYKNDFFGENNGALNSTMDLLDIQNQGIKEGVKNSASFRFMATMGNFATDDDLSLERNRFSEKNLKNGRGLLLFPSTYKDIKQIDSKPFVPDSETIKITRENIMNYYGVSMNVLQNKAYGEEWSAFYEGAVEPFAIQFSEVMTRMLYTDIEQSNGNFLMATANRLQYMTTADKVNVSTQMADRALMNIDEIREIWNLPPLPNGEGQKFIIRGEYYEANGKLNESGANNGNE